MGGTTFKKHPQETMVFRDLHIGSFHQIPLHGVSSCRSGRSVNFASFPIPGLERCEEHSEPERIETGIFTWPSRRSSSTVSVRPWRRQDFSRDNPSEAVEAALYARYGVWGYHYILKKMTGFTWFTIKIGNIIQKLWLIDFVYNLALGGLWFRYCFVSFFPCANANVWRQKA